MQHTPLQRTLRFVCLSIGFVLFLIMALYAAQTASDPRAIRGRPSRFGTPNALAQLTDANSVDAAAVPTRTLVTVTYHHSFQSQDKAGNTAAPHQPSPAQMAIKEGAQPIPVSQQTPSGHPKTPAHPQGRAFAIDKEQL